MELVSRLLETSHLAGRYSNFGPNCTALETEVQDRYFPEQSWSACTSCTAGLTAALLALRVEAEVAVPAFTFPATHAAVHAAGLEATTFDVDPQTGVLSATQVRSAARSGNLGAVMVVRPYGVWSDLAPLREVCRQHKLALVIDNASGFGVDRSIVSRYACDDAIEVFSLHATKTAGIGEGGLMMHPVGLRESVRIALNFGMRPGTSEPCGPGINGKMDEMRAAVARAMLMELPTRVVQRRAMAERLGALAVRAGIEPFVPVGQEERSPWQCFPLRLPVQVDPEVVVAECAASGLVARRYYHPAPSRSADARAALPEAARMSRQALCLPIYDGPEADQVEDLWATFLDALVRSEGSAVAVA